MKIIYLLFLTISISACVINPVEQAALDRESKQSLRNKLERADLALREARLTDAEVLYRDVSISNPDIPEVWLRLGNIYVRQGQHDAAVRVYKEGLRYDQEDARLWYNLSVVQIKQAVETLENANNVLAQDNPYRTRIQDLHQKLLDGYVSQSPAQQAIHTASFAGSHDNEKQE